MYVSCNFDKTIPEFQYDQMQYKKKRTESSKEELDLQYQC